MNDIPTPIPRNLDLMTRDETSKEVMINPFTIRPFTEDKAKIDPKYRVYLVLLNYYEDDGEKSGSDHRYEIITGRTETYERLRDEIEFYDPNTSKVMTEDVPLSRAITVVQFMRYIFTNHLVKDDGFDISEYVNEELEEVEEREEPISSSENPANVPYDDLLKIASALINN